MFPFLFAEPIVVSTIGALLLSRKNNENKEEKDCVESSASRMYGA